MIKTKLETFIKKYSLGNILDVVRWTCKNKVLTVNEITADKKLMVTTNIKNFDSFRDIEFIIRDTRGLKSKLAILGEEFTINLISGDENPNRIIAMELEDDRTTLLVNTGAEGDDKGKKPKLMNIPDYDVEIVLTEQFKTDFSKAKSSFSDVNLFTLIMSKKKQKLEMVLGYSSNNNTDRVALSVYPVEGKNTINTPINFSADALKEILNANSEAKDPILKVSEQGLAFIGFSDENFDSQYYLVKIPVED